MIMYDFIWFSWQSQILKNICKSNSSCVCIFCTLLHRHVSPSSPHKVLDYFVWSRLTNTYIYLPGLFEQDTKQNNLREKKHEKSARPDRSQGRLLVLLGVWLGRQFICFLSGDSSSSLWRPAAGIGLLAQRSNATAQQRKIVSRASVSRQRLSIRPPNAQHPYFSSTTSWHLFMYFFGSVFKRQKTKDENNDNGRHIRSVHIMMLASQ
jgi:hypothetical protein